MATKTKLCVGFDASTLARLRQAALAQDRPVGWVVRQLVALGLAQQSKKPAATAA